jgi:cyclopropane-fatty-acyl-phospholipid synthase
MTTSTTTPTRTRVTPPPPPAVEPPPDAPAGTAAAVIRPLVTALLGWPLPVRLELFDGSGLGPEGAPGTVWVRSPDALRRLVWAPGELGLARAFVSGDLEIEGDVFEVLRRLQGASRPDLRFMGWKGLVAGARAALRLGALGPPLAPPPEEVLPHGERHSARRDAASVSHHYDVGNDFYRLVLGPSLAYSCARFTDDEDDLETAQAAKFELVCRKLGLHDRPGARLLDVGCGWGSMVMHAAQRHGAQAVGITVSREQAELARHRVAKTSLGSRVDIRLQDYRDVRDEDFDAVSSIGMFEHVGRARSAEYFAALHARLRPGGRLLNHAISKPGSSKPGRRSFVHRYVFPDGELLDVGHTVLAMERAGFEVRDVESLREHYVRTLHAWVANLDAGWDDAVRLVGPRRARVWLLYMAGCANRFEEGAISVHQVLGVVPDDRGRSHMPLTGVGWDPRRRLSPGGSRGS